MRCLLKGEMSEDSSGTQYEPHNEDEGVSDSELSLELECRVDERSTVRTGGDKVRCTFGEGGGLVKGNIGVGVDGR